MYILYSHPFSQHSRRVAALMEEAGLKYEPRLVKLDEGEQMSPAYLELNPNHQVPTLIDGDFKLYESNAIMRYLCVKHRLTDWLPEGPIARGKTEQWLDWNLSQLGPATVDIVLNKVFFAENGDKAAIKRGENKLNELAPILSTGLSDDNFLAGPQPTIADLSVGANITHLRLADAIPDDARIAAWLQRVMEIPGFKRTLPPGYPG